jgi:hypothetical protein
MKKYNHLFKIPNDSEGKAFVSTLKKYMRDSDSIHTLRIKGRNPYVGYKAYNGGADGYVRLNEAENIAIYLKEDTNSYHKGFQVGQEASEWMHKRGVEEGYERGYKEASNDAKEHYKYTLNQIEKNEAKVKTDSYEKGYNDAKEHYEAKEQLHKASIRVRKLPDDIKNDRLYDPTDAFVKGYAQALDDFKTVLMNEYDYLGKYTDVCTQKTSIRDIDTGEILEKIDSMDEATKAVLRYKKPCEVESEEAFKRGIQVGKNIAYKRSVEAIQDHQEAVEGWEGK